MSKFEFSWKKTNINCHVEGDSFWFLTGRTLRVLTILTEVSDSFMMSLENGQTFLSSLTKIIDSFPGMQFVEDSEQGQQRSWILYDALLAPLFCQAAESWKIPILLLKQPEVLFMLTVSPVLAQQSPSPGLHLPGWSNFVEVRHSTCFSLFSFFQQSLLTSICHMSDT